MAVKAASSPKSLRYYDPSDPARVVTMPFSEFAAFETNPGQRAHELRPDKAPRQLRSASSERVGLRASRRTPSPISPSEFLK